MDFVNDLRCIQIENGELHLSSICWWNLQFFGGSEGAIINFQPRR